MKNRQLNFTKIRLKYGLLSCIILSTALLSAQEVTFQEPDKLKETTLEFQRSNGTLTNTFRFQNDSKITSSKKLKWVFNKSVFRILKGNEDITSKGYIDFNIMLPKVTVIFKPDFSTDTVQRLQFKTKDKDQLVYDAICVYPHLTLDRAEIPVSLNNLKDTISNQVVTINNIGYETLKVKVTSSESDILPIKETYDIPPKSSKNVDLSFYYAESLFAKNKKGHKKKTDSLQKSVTVSFMNVEYPENTIEKNFAVNLVKVADQRLDFDFNYLLFLIIPLALLLYIFFYRKSFTRYRRRLDRFYDNNEYDDSILQSSVSNFILDSKALSEKKSNYYVDKTISASKGKVLLKEFSIEFKSIENDTIKNRIIELFETNRDIYLGHLRPQKNLEDASKDKEVIKEVLKKFIQSYLKDLSYGIENNQMNQEVLQNALNKGYTEITDVIKDQNKSNQEMKNLLNKVTSSSPTINDEKAPEILEKVFDICVALKESIAIEELNNGASVNDCVYLLEKDTQMLERIGQILQDPEESLDDVIHKIVQENTLLNDQILNISSEQLLVTILNRLFGIIDRVKNAQGWKESFRNVFFRSLKDEESNARNSLKTYSSLEGNESKKQIPLEVLEHTLSEFFRLYAFSKVEESYVKESFDEVNFPVQTYEANILLLKGILLDIYNVHVVIPTLFKDTFDSSIHRKVGATSEVMSSASEEFLSSFESQTIMDFKEIVFQLYGSSEKPKTEVFTN